MLIWINFLAVVLIWSTTPLAIKITAEAIEPVASLTYRIGIAVLLGCMFAVLLDAKSLAIRKHYKMYFAASLGIFPNMLVVYWATQYISSGMVALMFGLSPFFSMLLEKPMLGSGSFMLRHWLSGAIAILGLFVILIAPSSAQDNLWVGVPLMMIANITFTLSGLWVKRLNRDGKGKVEPMQQALGAMVFSFPSLLICMLFMGEGGSLNVESEALAALLYLVVMGSIVGFVAYYKLLKDASLNTVAVIPFITPALALVFGMLVAGESFNIQVLVGAMLILLGLALYQNVFAIGWQHLRKVR